MVYSIELVLHILVITAAIISLIFLAWSIKVAVQNLTPDDITKMLLGFLLAGFFSTFRWVGGTLSRLNTPIMDKMYIQVLWGLSGILAAICIIYASKKAIDFSRRFGFRG